MERDLDLIRTILLTIEGSSNFNMKMLYNLGYSNEVINYQLDLLNDVKYVDMKITHVQGQKAGIYSINRLTQQGHDYLDSIRDVTIWKNVKEKIAKLAGSVSLEIIKTIAIEIIKIQL
jgi:hypothetical protein